MSVHLIDRGEVSGGTTGLGEGNVLCCDKRPGPELGLAQLGLALYDELEELLGAEAGIRRKGALVVHGGAASWDAEPARIAALRATGVECELLDPAQVQAVEPELSGELLGCSSFPRDLQCAPRAIARALAREAERLGARVETGRAADSIGVAGGRVTGVAGDRRRRRGARRGSVERAARAQRRPRAAARAAQGPARPARAAP